MLLVRFFVSIKVFLFGLEKVVVLIMFLIVFVVLLNWMFVFFMCCLVVLRLFILKIGM